MNIYKEIDYRKIVKNLVIERKRLDRSISFQALANYIRVPKSYVSRVLHGVADFSTDQIFMTSKYFELNEEEQQYLMLTLEYSRTALQTRRSELIKSLRTIQTQQLDTKRHLTAKSIEPSLGELADYYLDPAVQLTHICLAIPKFQKNPEKISEALQIAKPRIVNAIIKLEKMRLIERNEKGITLLVENLHLPKDSSLYRSWRNQLRQMATHRIDNAADEAGYSFSVVFSGDEETRRDIQNRFLEWLKNIEGIVGKAQQQNVYQLSLDLFRWTGD
ncbi:MAG: DUF4423 domain-containing protein [Oligoflexales bacterium]